MQLLILFASLLALAAPILSLASGRTRRHVLLIDRSASMSATDVEPSRLEEAKRQAAKIVEQAELTARHEVVLAKQALRQEAAELTAQMAADAIRKAATPEDQRKWIQTYIDKIGEVQ